MYRKTRILIFLILGIIKAQAQTVLWADKVLEVSSEHTDQFYSPKNRADQLLGTPSVYPQLSVSPCAWQPNGSDFGEDYIKVGFEKAIHIKQVALVENCNAGAVARIFGYDESGKEYLLYQSDGNKPNLRKRFWRIMIEKPPAEKINAIKLLINHRISQGIKQYDAVAISDSEISITAEINLAEDIPEELEKENLGNVINSQYGEVAPIITPDGKTLYFTRLDHPENITLEKSKSEPFAQDIWYSKLNPSGQWSSPVNIGPPINNEFDNAAATASSDGKTLYILNVYTPGGKLQAGLSKTHFAKKSWSVPEEVIIQNFQAIGQENPITKKNEIRTEYAISYDENVLIMGLQRSQTFGGKDLYVCFKKADGTFSLPKNMGNIINTADNEGSPFLSADKKTLYFNSKGFPGYGDADIFVSRRLDDTWTNWSEPMNLGPKINSESWDGYFSIPASGDFAYLSSKDGAIGGEDIFKIKLFPSIQPDVLAVFSGKIIDQESKEPIPMPFVIQAEDKNGEFTQIEVSPDQTSAEFSVLLPIGFKYKIALKKTGYLELSEQLDLITDNSYSEIKKELELIPLKAGNKMILQNLFFDQGKYDIKSDSFEELARIISLMKEYPTMRILLEGYTDNQGDFNLNVKLAEDRVNSVKTYLETIGGIHSNRIETKSWGPMKPISSNSTEESREKNRRVEFTILKM